MIFKIVISAFAVLATFVVLECNGQGSSGMFKYLFVGPTEEEWRVCSDKAGTNRTLQDVQKDKRLSCNVRCIYSNRETEIVLSPKGTYCCMGGGFPTGCCNEEGMCLPGFINNCKNPFEGLSNPGSNPFEGLIGGSSNQENNPFGGLTGGSTTKNSNKGNNPSGESSNQGNSGFGTLFG